VTGSAIVELAYRGVIIVSTGWVLVIKLKTFGVGDNFYRHESLVAMLMKFNSIEMSAWSP
jgi:hypothetical protein